MRNEELDNILEKSLRIDPDFYLSADFAQKVTIKVVRRAQWKTDLYEYLYLTVVLLSLFVAVSVFYYFIDKELVMKFITFVTANIVQVFFVLFILNFILFADRVLLRLLFSRWNRT